jgi:diguanylate cyclase (GGDEF)-like protein
MLHKILNQYGVLKSTIILTVSAILISILITLGMTTLLWEEISTTAIVIATVVPAIIAPIFSQITLRLIHQLDLAEKRLRHLSITDELTKAYNRRYFMEMANNIFMTAKRYGDTFAVIIFDVDDFKRINDTYGHAAGDKVLYILSEICKEHVRDSDIFARYGGEEFAILVPRTSPPDLLKFAERIRINLSEVRIRHDENTIQFTVSMGASMFESTSADLDAILTRADEALYSAKKQGKNCTVLMQ